MARVELGELKPLGSLVLGERIGELLLRVLLDLLVEHGHLLEQIGISAPPTRTDARANSRTHRRLRRCHLFTLLLFRQR